MAVAAVSLLQCDYIVAVSDSASEDVCWNCIPGPSGDAGARETVSGWAGAGAQDTQVCVAGDTGGGEGARLVGEGGHGGASRAMAAHLTSEMGNDGAVPAFQSDVVGDGGGAVVMHDGGGAGASRGTGVGGTASDAGDWASQLAELSEFLKGVDEWNPTWDSVLAGGASERARKRTKD